MASARGGATVGELHAQALARALAAARLVPPGGANEPLRSLLYRSAASLAYHAGRWGTMGRLARAGLRGFPPPDERHALRVLARLARMKAHQAAGQDAAAQ